MHEQAVGPEFRYRGEGVDAPKRQGVMEEIGQQLGILAETIEELGRRLLPVLSPFDDPRGAEVGPEPVKSAIRDVRDTVAHQTGRLRALIERLEV